MIPFSAGPLRWLYVDLNSFFASVEQQEDPAIAGQPVIVTPVESDFTAAIAVSYEAKARGVRNGMSVREAREVCPEVHVRPARHDVYVDYSQRIVAEVDRHLPVTRICSIDEVACLLIGRDIEDERAGALGRQIQQGLLSAVGASIRCSVGVAPSLLLAKMASDMQKPLGLTILPAARLPEALLELPISDIPGVGRRMAERLTRAGCDSMAALWALTPGRARALWGSIEGERVWYGLHGIDPAERPAPERRSIGHSVVLIPSQRTFAGARLAARGLLMRAATRLRQMNYRARSLSVSLSLQPEGWTGRDCRLAPVNDTFALLRAFDRLWQELDPALARGGVRKTGIVLGHLLAPGSAQLDLFELLPEEPTGRGDAASRALDQINRKFGRDSLRVGEASEALSKYAGAKIAFTRIPSPLDFT